MMTFWKRRSRAPSFSIDSRYSFMVVAPIHWISPRASAGLNILEASRLPEALPAPTRVCISSMNRITSLFCSSSFIIAFIRSSNCPRYLVPATSEPKSSVTTRLLNKARDTLRSMIRIASPSATALFPTPGSPMSKGLFFFLRLRIWETRSISLKRPTTGSSLPWRAIRVKSFPKLSKTGVLVFWFELFF